MANDLNAPQVGSSRWALPDPNRVWKKSSGVQATEIKKEKSDDDVKVEEVEVTEPEPVDEPQKRTFNEKEKLNSPLAIAKQGRRSIRHETLERDHDEH